MCMVLPVLNWVNMKREMVGYGGKPPDYCWPNGAKLAINFVINYEEGAELSPVNKDSYSETYGGEFPLSPKPEGLRSLSMESLFEYGSRVGIWRLLRLFDKAQIPVTFFATGMALSLNPVLCDYLKQAPHEVAGHGWRWIDYAQIPKEEEKKQIKHCIQMIHQLTERTIQGWYTGRTSVNTRPLLKELGGFLYDSDSYADDLPYYEENHLIIPYNLDCNDFRFCTSPGFSTDEDFLNHLINSFNFLHEEGLLSLMSIGLHPRISGRPGRALMLHEFIKYIKTLPDIWVTTRLDIARFWIGS